MMPLALWRKPGNTVLLTACVSLAICLGLAGLHYYELHRISRAARSVQDVGRARDDLTLGFLHVVLSGQDERAWQREQGLSLLARALQDFERALFDARREERGQIAAFRASARRFERLLKAAAGDAAQLSGVELRLALHELVRSADDVDSLLRAQLGALQSELDRDFALLLAGSVLALLLLCVALYRVERQRSASLQVLDAIADSSTDSIFAKDTSGRYLFFNRAAQRWSGKRADQLIGRTDHELLTEAEAGAVAANDAEIMRSRAVRSYEEILTSPDGPRTYLATKGPLVNAAGKLGGVFGISRDITERKLAERLLEDSRAKLELVIESLHEGLIIVDCETGAQHWNRAALALHGFGPADEVRALKVHGEQAFTMHTPEGEPVAYAQGPLTRVRGGETFEGLVLRLQRPGETLDRLVSYKGALALGADGRARFALLSMDDVTESQRAEEAQRHRQRLEALGTLSAGVAHDFNNILFAISGNAELAFDQVPLGSELSVQLGEVLRAAERATDLVRRILLFARSEESRRRPVELWSVVEEALRMLRPTLAAQIELVVSGAPLARAVHADVAQLHQVITNLVTNAAYAVTQPSQVARPRICVTLVQRSLTQALTENGRSLPPGEYAHLSVEDNGPGMDQATSRRAFDPFFTTKPVGAGTGLGLSVVHGIVSSHEGVALIDSQPGHGTTLHVYLPLGGEPVAPPPGSVAPAAVGGGRVLFVDDESALVRVATQGLTQLGYDVQGFVSASEALRAFASAPQRFDVVVTDLSMSELSGFELTRRVLALRPDVPVVMMSGYVGTEDRAQALAAGVRELLLKPAPIRDLAHAIEVARGRDHVRPRLT